METKDDTYTQAGIAAFLPGMQHMIDLMQQQLDEARAHLARLQKPATTPQPARGRGRPRKSSPRKTVSSPAKSAAARSGWPSDPAERSREIATKDGQMAAQ